MKNIASSRLGPSWLTFRLALNVLVVALGPFGPIGARAISPAPKAHMVIAREWQAVEITFTSSQVYANPFLDVDVTAVFVAPSGATLTRPGFWDGGDVWKVRMAPTELGLWRYRITASDPTNMGLNPPEGQVISLPYRGDLAIFRHGFLKTSANGRYLAYADSSPFFWLADTHWFFDSKERWDSANKLGWASEFKGIVDRRVAQHFTVYQSVIFGPSPTYWAPGQVGELIAPEYFRDNLDRKMQYIADQGLVNAFGLGFSENIDGQVATQVRLARYVVARYGAYPIVWFTGGEVAGYDPGLRQSRVDGWRQVALEIDREDAYHQPQTAHYTSGWPLDYQGESWLDFTMVQGAHGSLPPLQVYANYYDRSPAIPLLEGELNYEQIYPVVDDALVRASAYRAIQAGSFGYSYGAEGIWNAVWDNTDTSGDASYAHWNWYDAIDFPGGAQMGYMADFYTRFAWETLTPRPTGWAQWSLSQPDQAMPAIKADDEANNIVVYFPEQYNPQSAAGSLGPLPDQVYQVRWLIRVLALTRCWGRPRLTTTNGS